MPEPVAQHPRVAGASWEDTDAERVRLVGTAEDAQRVEDLPVPDVEEPGPWDVMYLDGTTVEVLDLASRKMWSVRRGQCGLGCCCCDLVAWPSDHTGPFPATEPYDGWPFWLDDGQWLDLEKETGKRLSTYGWDRLLAVVERARRA